jgi:hypothetical protein
MKHSSSSGNRSPWLALALAAVGCTVCYAPASAQVPRRSDAFETPGTGADESGQNAQGESEALPMPSTYSSDPDPIGGGPEPVRGTYYTSPLKKIGSDLFFGSYAIGAVISLAYLVGVYPVQALFGSSKLETVLLWTLVPIVGPWFAQYEDSVRSKLFWRVVLIGDAALQASGVVLGLLGLALSGRRKLEPATAARIEWNLGVAGAGLAGVTFSVRTL